MKSTNFTLDIIAALNKQLTKRQLKSDLKTLDNSLSVKILAKLTTALSKQQLKKDLKQLNDLYVQVGANVNVDKDTKNQLQKRIKELQNTISDIEVKLKVSKSKVGSEVESARKTVQAKANKAPIGFDIEVKRSKAIADIEYLGKRFSKLFTNVAAKQKYENILMSAYSISDENQLRTVRNQIAAFTSELKANGLASQSLGDKWRNLIDRSKSLFSAASIITTIFTQVKQAISTFLQLDTAMTNLYKVQDQITSRDQFSGLLTKWNKLAQNLAVTTESLISSMEAWSKIGFDLDMSEQLAQITAIFEKTAEISNEKATSTLISAAQAFTEIDNLGVDDYVKRVESVGNKINAIGNKYAIDSEGIADGLQNASAALKVAGNDLNETIALITATNKIYQEPSESSNMLKVASMRLRGQVDALKSMGEDAEGVSTDLTKIQQQVYELTGNKVNIFKDDENLKSTYQMILEIGEVFDSLNDRSQADLLEVMFGKQRASAGASLLLNYEELEKIKNDSMNAANSMAEEYSKYMESAEAHITIFKEKIVETYSTFMSGDLIKYTADVGSGILDLVNSTDLLKHGILAVLALNVSKGITSFGTAIATTVKQMNTLGGALQQVKNLPTDEMLRADIIEEIGESTKSLAEKNLKLLLSQKQLSLQDKTNILTTQGLTEEEAKAKLEKMGLITTTNAQSAANVTEAATTFTLKNAMTSLKTSIIGVGTSIKAAFLSNPIGFILTGITTIISVATTVISNHNQKLEEATQKIEEAKSAIDSIKSDFDKLSASANDAKKKYAELAQEVENLGKTNQSRGKLSTEDYEEFLGLSNQLAELFPQLTKGYDENGNAILDLSGDVDTIVGSLDNLVSVQQKLANQEIMKNMPDVWAGYILELKEFNKELSSSESVVEEHLKWAEALRNRSELTLGNEYYNTLLVDAAKEAGIMNSRYGNDFYKEKNMASDAGSSFLSASWDFSKLSDDEYERLLNKLLEFGSDYEDTIQIVKGNISSANSGMASYINTWLSTEWNYNKMDANIQNVVKNMLFNGDWVDLLPDSVNSGNWDDVSNWLQRNFLYGINKVQDNEEISKALSEIFANVELTPETKANYIKQIQDYFGENDIVTVLLQPQLVETESLQKQYTDAISKFGESGTDVLNSFFEDNSINDSSEIDYWNDVTKEASSATEAVRMYNEAKDIPDESFISFSNYLTSSTDSLDKFQSSVKSAADAYEKLLSGNYSSTDLLDSIQAINKAASDMGESIDWETISTSGNPLQAIQDAIESVSKTYADSVLSGAEIDADSKFGQMLANIVQESYKSESALSSLNTQIDSLQSAYNNLTDIVTAYNETGYITFDQLQTLLAMEPQYLSCLVDENGQLQLNQESMLALANQRLNDAEAQAVQQAITELNELELQNEKTAVEENAQAFSNAVNDLAAYNEELAGTIGEASIASSVIHDLNTAINGAEAQGASDVQIGTILDNLNTKLQLIRNTRLNLGKSMGNIVGGKTSPSASSSAKSEFEETVDFFKQRVEVLDDALSHLDTTLDNVAGSFGKNSLIDAELGINEEKFNNYTDALSMYTQKANEAFSKIPADIASRVKDGAVALTDFIGDGNKDVAEAIKEYESWADKVADCKQELAELQKEIRQLELEKFNNIMDDFENQFNLRGDSKDLISKQIDLLKEAGELIGESFYTAQIDQSQKQLALLENEKAQLVNQMSSAISSGKIQSGTEEWLEMVNALNSVDGSILDCKKSIEEFDNELLNLHTEVFNRIQEQFSNFDSEISNIVDLFDDFEVSDDKGIWSKEAIAQLGLLSQQYELAQYRVQQYNDEIDKLNAQYLSGKYSATEYADNLAGLNSSMWDSVKASESALSSIMNLNEARVENAVKGIEKEIDAYKELIDAQLDSLDQEKALHDYKSSIADKTQDLTNIDRQIAAVKNDTSASGIARLKKLQSERTEAKKALEEAEYEHSIESQQTALNHQLKDYEESRNEEIDKLRESLNDKEAILAESFDTVKNNAALVGQEIATIATRHGVTVSNALISSWQSGENAIASYGEVLSQNTSVFIGNIMGVENEVWNLQAQADVTADSLANMFGTSADNLVNELNASYFAEANLANMTNALQQSLVNTLERGYDVSSIVNSLNAVTDAANRAKAATSSIGNSNASLTYTGFNNSDADRKYSVKDEHNKSLFTGNLSQCQAWVSAHNYGFGSIVGDNINVIDNNKKNVYTSVSANTSLKKYASGTRSIDKDQLAIVNEEGPEIIYSPTLGTFIAPLREGDMVFDNEASERLWKLGQGIMPPDITKNLSLPQVPPNVNNNNTSVHFDSMFRIEGDVVDADRITRRMEETACKIADRQIDKNWREFSKELRYGGSASSMYARK